MKSYHNKENLKTRLLKEVEKHRLADSIIQGCYGPGIGDVFYGCSVGCSIESLNRINGTQIRYSEHEGLAEALDIDVRLCYLQDAIFESLTVRQSLLWPGRFYEALPVGADTSLVWPKYALWLLNDLLNSLHNPPPVEQQLHNAIDFYQQILAGNPPPGEGWEAAMQMPDIHVLFSFQNTAYLLSEAARYSVVLDALGLTKGAAYRLAGNTAYCVMLDVLFAYFNPDSAKNTIKRSTYLDNRPIVRHSKQANKLLKLLAECPGYLYQAKASRKENVKTYPQSAKKPLQKAQRGL